MVRVAPAAGVRSRRLADEEVASGITDGPSWVPFEKGDSSGDDGGAAKWRRENPIVIDWSPEAVELLRTRAVSGVSYRRPRIQNEHLWGKSGVTFNSTASYLRTRAVPEGGIFGHKTPVIRPAVAWLAPESLLALLNAPTLDFVLRTFLGSRMQIEIGDIRRLPLPVLTADQASTLEALGRRAIAAKETLDAGTDGDSLDVIEAELDAYTRDLYGVAADAHLWVVR